VLFSAHRIGLQPEFISPELLPPYVFLSENVENVGPSQQVCGNSSEKARRLPSAYSPEDFRS
jgi:hypothetical protein